jgi:hypothetical protein
MNSHERRMFILLDHVPHDEQVFVWDKGQGSAHGARRRGRIAGVGAERMVVELEFGSDADKVVAHVPLVFVSAVWTDEKGAWNVDILGAIDTARSSRTPRFVPKGSVP